MYSEIIVALDVASASEIPPLLDLLPDEIKIYKIGLELFCAEGPSVVELVRNRDKEVFLDLKLHDIPRTVERAVKRVAELGVKLLTVHTSGGRTMLDYAAQAALDAGDKAPAIIGVTTLTSLNEDDFADLGIERTIQDQALCLGRLAMQAGIDGLVSSVWEAAALRKDLGQNPLLVTPGIRMSSDAVGDQKRVATPADAVHAGSNYLVVGRSILAAEDPHAAAVAILANMKSGTPTG